MSDESAAMCLDVRALEVSGCEARGRGAAPHPRFTVACDCAAAKHVLRVAWP